MSSGSGNLSHDLADLTKIVVEHQTEIEDHGHFHDDLVDLAHAYYGHANEMADSDHNVAFLTPRRGSYILAPARLDWPMAKIAIAGRNPFGLDRPPRG